MDETFQTVSEPIACEFDDNVDVNQFDDMEGTDSPDLSYNEIKKTQNLH